MCGIAGVLSWGLGPLPALERMTDLVAHRGPDGEGHLLYEVTTGKVALHHGPLSEQPTRPQSPFVYLGHRRLAILDLSTAGAQPMGTPDSRLYITFNGEIYNYVELREELRAHGHRFVTGTDTEVVLHAYRQWGTDCFQRFNGMWALAILDVTNNSLLLCLDRFGVKPMHHVTGPGFVAFGSEIKQLLPFVGSPRANESAVAEFVATGVTHHGEATCFDGVQRMTPGQLMVFDLRTGALKSRQWYELPYNPEYGRDDAIEFERATAKFRELFVSAVSLRMRSDVPVGSCLSGGLDSSSIVGVASKSASSPMSTFTSCWNDRAIDEWRYASEVVRANNCSAYRAFPTWEQFQSDLDAILWHQEEPFGGTSIFAQWSVMKLARETAVPVLLDGQGSDELFGGYHGDIPMHLRDAIRTSPVVGIRKAMGMRTAGYRVGLGALARALSPSAVEALYRHRVRRAGGQPNGMMFVATDLATTLRDEYVRGPLQTLLRYEDRNSMAFSIESRCPFMDYRVAEHVFSLPRALLTHGAILKPILRASMKEILPPAVFSRTSKLGFNAPQFSIDGPEALDRGGALSWRRKIVARWRRRFALSAA